MTAVLMLNHLFSWDASDQDRPIYHPERTVLSGNEWVERHDHNCYYLNQDPGSPHHQHRMMLGGCNCGHRLMHVYGNKFSAGVGQMCRTEGGKLFVNPPDGIWEEAGGELVKLWDAHGKPEGVFWALPDDCCFVRGGELTSWWLARPKNESTDIRAEAAFTVFQDLESLRITTANREDVWIERRMLRYS